MKHLQVTSILRLTTLVVNALAQLIADAPQDDAENSTVAHNSIPNNPAFAAQLRKNLV